MTTAELLKLKTIDITKMTRKELASVVSQLSTTANKRLKRLETTPMGRENKAYVDVMKIGKFSVANKNRNELLSEFVRVRGFLTKKTSTVSGWKEVRKELISRLGSDFSSQDMERSFWKAYRMLTETDKALINSYGSTEAQRHLRQEMSKTEKLSSQEIKEYRELFPDNTTHLENLSGYEVSIIRTLIEMGKDYEQKQQFSGFFG